MSERVKIRTRMPLCDSLRELSLRPMLGTPFFIRENWFIIVTTIKAYEQHTKTKGPCDILYYALGAFIFIVMRRCFKLFMP